MTTKHTPGPWELWDDAKQYYRIVHKARTVCMVPKRHEASQANVQLITAIPDLLEAAQALVDGLEAANHPERNFSQVTRLREAIAKATNKA